VPVENADSQDFSPALFHPEPVSLRAAFWVWFRISLLSFGGPAGQIALMHRILVDEKRWIGEHRFLHALNYCMVLPGPEAQQLAIYIGWLMHKTRGGIVAGGLFILPGAVSIMTLSWIYVLYGQLGFVTALFFGLKCAVLAVVLQAVVRIASRALNTGVMRGLAAISFFLIFFCGVPFPIIILGAGLIGYVAGRRGVPAFSIGGGHAQGKGATVADKNTLLGEDLPAHASPRIGQSVRHSLVWMVLWLTPVALLLIAFGGENVFSQIATFFSTMAVVTFGGAYAVLAYVAQQAVEHYHWLTAREMLDGLGMAETTPGPLIMVLQFVGFIAAFRHPGLLPPLLAGTLGGLLATWVTFTPCFLWIFLGAPFIERTRGNTAVTGALSAITAAVVGVVLNLAAWFAIHTIFSDVRRFVAGPLHFDLPRLASIDIWALALTSLSIVAIFRLRIGMLPTLGAASLTGVALFLFGLKI
jgi:chromate transporter